MRSLGWGVLVLLSLLPVAGRAADEPPLAKLSPFNRVWLQLYDDGKGHLVAWWHNDGSGEQWVFYGTRPKEGPLVMYQQLIEGGGGDLHSYSLAMWEPRFVDGWQRSFGVTGGVGEMQCGDRKTRLTAVPPAEAARLLAGARLLGRRWNRKAYALVRDDKGIYTYVDKEVAAKEGRTFRIFRGKKGEMKLLPMLNVVSDASGDIFATKEGELRLVIDREQMAEDQVRKPFWIKGKGKTELTVVDTYMNSPLIYGELGVYEGQLLGTPCDDL